MRRRPPRERPPGPRRPGRDSRVRRRTVLRASAALGAAIPVAGCTALRGTDPDPYEPLGRVAVDGAAEAVVGDGGDTAYVAATDGFATVDVTDPAEPTVTAEVRGLLGDDNPPLLEILDVSVDGDRLAVAGPANPSEDVFEGVVLYDVSDPAAPELAADPIETDAHVHNCTLVDDRLYVVVNDGGRNPLVVYDVADDRPDELGRWSLLDHEPDWADVHWLLWYLHDVRVRDDHAVLAHWNAGTYVLDVSDPSDPGYVTHVRDPGVSLDDQRAVTEDAVRDAQHARPGNDHYATLGDRGDLLAVGRESWAIDPERATLDWIEPAETGASGIDLYEWAGDGRPERVATIEPPAAADERYREGTWTTAHNFELREGRLYASWYQGGVTIHDVSDPTDPERLAAWRDPDEAAFWTARVADPAEVFVASSTALVPGADTEGALYTFPSREGEQADPPSLD